MLIVIATRESAAVLPEGLIKAAAGTEGRWLGLAPLTIDELRALAQASGVRLSARAVQRLRRTRAATRSTRARCSTSCPPTRGTARTTSRRRARSRDRARTASPPARPTPRGCSEAVAVLGPRAPLATAAALGGVEEPFDALEEASDAGLLRWVDDAAASRRPPSRTR